MAVMESAAYSPVTESQRSELISSLELAGFYAGAATIDETETVTQFLYGGDSTVTVWWHIDRPGEAFAVVTPDWDADECDEAYFVARTITDPPIGK